MIKYLHINVSVLSTEYWDSMRQAILISDNEVVNSLYEVNLRAYVGVNVTVKSTVESAIDLINQNPNIDAIICFNKINKTDNAVQMIYDTLAKIKVSIPIIGMGVTNIDIPNSLLIKNKYDIKALLQSMAKVMEVTAKEMANMSVPKYFPIPLKLFSQIEKSHCDIYFRNQKENFEFEYFKILEKSQPIGDSLQKYISEGIEHLHIDADERLRFINKTSKAMIGELERDNLSSEERIEITQQGMSIVAEEVFENQVISSELVEVSKACIASINKVCKAVPKLKNLLGMLMENQSDYVYKHSILTTYIATQIISKISWGSAEQQSKIAFSLFFHDIFLVPIYKKYPDAVTEEDLLFMDNVTDAEKQVVLDHAKMAGELVKTFPKCPMGADMIITQHHGMTSGQGFAVSFKDDISPLSKIMIISEEIANSMLISMAHGDKISTNKEAIAKRLSEKYKNHTYGKVVEAFKEIKV